MKAIKTITIAFTAISMVSCGAYYRTITTLDRKGNAHREIYTKADSAFMTGDLSYTPFLFDISSGWDIIPLDSAYMYDYFGEEKIVNVKVTRQAPSIDSFSEQLKSDGYNKSFAAPEETLTKKFRWFYTNYAFKGVYKRLNYDVPIPIDSCLSKEEQRLWTQGDFSSYSGMNGIEISQLLSEIEDKFTDWYARNCFEISLNILSELAGEKVVEADKDKLFKQLNRKNQDADILPETVCELLDAFYGTTRFSKLYNENGKTIEEKFEDSTSVIHYLGTTISYELVVPGEILSSNSSDIHLNTLKWKVDGIRIFFDDYTLAAEYRVVNIWAFIISAFILIIAIVSITLLLKRKRSI